MTKADELARGLFNCLSRDRYLTEKEHDRIVEVLHEYGLAVRQRDAEKCEQLADLPRNASQYREGRADGCNQCANAISREPLP